MVQFVIQKTYTVIKKIMCFDLSRSCAPIKTGILPDNSIIKKKKRGNICFWVVTKNNEKCNVRNSLCIKIEDGKRGMIGKIYLHSFCTGGTTSLISGPWLQSNAVYFSARFSWSLCPFHTPSFFCCTCSPDCPHRINRSHRTKLYRKIRFLILWWGCGLKFLQTARCCAGCDFIFK